MVPTVTVDPNEVLRTFLRLLREQPADSKLNQLRQLINEG